jgi:hypothetical protein
MKNSETDTKQKLPIEFLKYQKLKVHISYVYIKTKTGTYSFNFKNLAPINVNIMKHNIMKLHETKINRICNNFYIENINIK